MYQNYPLALSLICIRKSSLPQPSVESYKSQYLYSSHKYNQLSQLKDAFSQVSNLLVLKGKLSSGREGALASKLNNDFK